MVVCTVVTSSHLGYARTMFDSVRRFNTAINCSLLVVDEDENIRDDQNGVEIYYLQDLIQADSLAEDIYKTYREEYDKLRWSLKSVFIKFLIEKGFEKVIFSDPDTYYFNDPSFLFDELDTSKVILTPHWRGKWYKNDRFNFNLQFTGGLFNAGFIGVNKSAVDVMDWWADCCLNQCEIDTTRGQYVDQTYLNLIPIYFDNIKILKHQGCNVANWNLNHCIRSINVDGVVVINNNFNIVFIHFTKSTINGITSGQDKFLEGHLNEYLGQLKLNGIRTDDLFKFPNARVKRSNSIWIRIKRKLS